MRDQVVQLRREGPGNDPEGFISRVNALLTVPDERLLRGTLQQRMEAAYEILDRLSSGRLYQGYQGGGAAPKEPPEIVYVAFNPTTPETEESVAAMARVVQHRQNLAIAGPFELDDETKFEINESLKSLGIKPEELNLEEKHFDIAFAIHSQGGSSEDFERKIDGADFLTKEDRLDLNKSNLILKGLEESQKDLTKDLQVAYRHPEIVLQTFVPEISQPNFQVLNLQRTEQKLTPNFEEFFASTKAVAEEGIKKAAGKALGAAKQKAKKVATAEVKKLGTEAVKAGSKQFVKKGAAWLAAKLGISLVAGVSSSGVTLALQLIYEGFKLLKKGISWAVRLLTGEKDTKKALGVLGVVMIAGGLAINSSLLILAGAGLSIATYLNSVGIMAAGSSSMGFFHAVIMGVVAVIIPFLTPLVVVLVGISLFVILTVFIINNSALVVPFGSLSFTGPGPGPGPAPSDCIENPTGGTPPEASGIIFSPDGNYAFPVAPGAAVNYACYHWDHKNAVDIFPQSPFSPLVAYTSGTITTVSLAKDYPTAAGGNYIVLTGNDGRKYLYSHNCEIFVSVGDSVSVGQVIATTDTTGNAHSEHVHFGITIVPNNFDADGAGLVCPQEDFELKFNLGNCTNPDELCI